MQSLQSMPQPVLAKVQGPAMAAGCQLALSCDLVVASENAYFQTPGGGAGWFCFTPMVALTRAIGGKFAFEMLMSGEPVPAQVPEAEAGTDRHRDYGRETAGDLPSSQALGRRGRL